MYLKGESSIKLENEDGENGLFDKRGRPYFAKSVKVLTPKEKQALEIEKLKSELERKDMVIEVLKKHRDTGTNGKKFSFIHQEEKYDTIKYFKENRRYTIDFLCKTLNLPKSSYYKWLNRSIPQKEIQDEELATLILDYHDTFEGVLGYRQMTFYINYLIIYMVYLSNEQPHYAYIKHNKDHKHIQ